MFKDPIFTKDSPRVRFVQLDVLRGFAVLGIYGINIFVFALPVTLGPLPSELNDGRLVNAVIAIGSEVYIEGTMRALFSMLFGASALIFLSDERLATRGIDVVDRYYRRTLLLVLFGLIHAYFLLWPYDVLYVYGLFGLVLFPLRGLSARILLICGIVLLVLGDLELDAPQLRGDAATTVGHDLMQEHIGRLDTGAGALIGGPTAQEKSFETESDPDAANTSSEPSYEESSMDEIRVEVAITAYRSDYATIFAVQRRMVMEKQSTTVYRDYIFDIGGMMLVGMALLKTGVLSGQRARHVYLVLVLVGYVLGALTRFAFAFGGHDTDPGVKFTGYNMGRLLIALGHVGMIGLFCHSVRLKSVANLLASVGRMALTNYLLQTVISIGLFYGFGLALYAVLERYQVALVGIGVWLLQIVYSNLWLMWFRYGPLEWLWRSLIYGKMQPNRRAAKTDKVHT